MSIRAYRINKIDQEQTPTFNLYHDTGLLEFLEQEDTCNARTQDGGGYIEVSTNMLKKAVKQAKKLKLEDYTVSALNDDIVWAEKHNHEYIMYSCF